MGRKDGAFDHGKMQERAVALQAQVLAIMGRHVGAETAIQARAIARDVGMRDDRAVREAIRQLRRDGHLILSSVGSHPGYYMAANVEEWRAFCDSNLRPRAFDILETVKAMTAAAGRTFGAPGVTQMKLEL